MTDLYNAREGLDGRQPGVYLDEEERRKAEVTRAYREGREPDFNTFRPYVGDVLVPEDQLEGFGRAVTSPVLTVDSSVPAEGEGSATVAQEEERRINVPENGVGVPVGATEEGTDGGDEGSGTGDPDSTTSDPFTSGNNSGSND